MSKKIQMILMAAGLLVTLLFATGLFLIWQKVSDIAAGTAAAPAVTAEDSAPGDTNRAITSLDTFIVNLADHDGRRFLRITMDLEYADADFAQEITRRLSQIKDKVIMILTGKKYDDINSVKGKENLRQEIMESLNGFLTTGSITYIYFTELVIQ